MEFGMSTDYIRKTGAPLVFIERAMDKEMGFIFHCTADITGAVTDMYVLVSDISLWDL